MAAHHLTTKFNLPISQLEKLTHQRTGITEQEYSAMLAHQGGLCAICGRRETVKHYLTGTTRRLAVDHDHKTGKIRGLLCGRCNLAIGGMADDPFSLAAAIEYLKAHGSEKPQRRRRPKPTVFAVEKNTAMRKRLPKFLTAEELAALIESSHAGMERTAFQLAALAGLRISEITKATVEDVDLSQRLFMVRQGKGDKDRNIPIGERLYHVLKSWIGDRRTGWLFPSPTHRWRHVSDRYLQLAIKGAAFRCKLTKRVTPHMLRHTFACNLLRSGADIREVQDLMGHESIQTTAVYLHAQPERLRAAVDRL